MKFVPHGYQREGFSQIMNQNALALFWEMGLGKTVVTLSAVRALKFDRFQVCRVLVIAPKKVAEATWSREAARWDHLKGLRVVPIMGPAAKRIKALYTPGDVWVIARDNVSWLVDFCRNAWPFDMVVIDELSSFKSPDAKRFKQLSHVRPHIKRVVGLTGTPAPNGLIDLWAQIFLLDGGARLGENVTLYRDWYFDYDGFTHKYEIKKGADAAIKTKLQGLCYSLQAADYLELPAFIVEDIPVLLDPAARKAYDLLEQQLFLQVNADLIDATTAAVLTGKLLQLCNGACYADEEAEMIDTPNGRMRVAKSRRDQETQKVLHIHDCKIEAFSEVVEGLNGEHALVFYSFKHDLPRLHKALEVLGLRVRELRSDADAVAWNNREVDILLAHPASCAYGLNLQQGGNHVIWFGLTWSLELYQQANARIFRQGQQSEKVFVHRLLVVDGADERVVEVLNEKDGVQRDLMEWLKQKAKKAKGGT